jgi:hypothetical protein
LGWSEVRIITQKNSTTSAPHVNTRTLVQELLKCFKYSSTKSASGLIVNYGHAPQRGKGELEQRPLKCAAQGRSTAFETASQGQRQVRPGKRRATVWAASGVDLANRPDVIPGAINAVQEKKVKEKDARS